MTAVKFLEAAVEEAGPNSQIGGEAQLWLALAYQVGLILHCGIFNTTAVSTSHNLAI